MQVELNSEEIQYLDNLLERHLTGLIREISHTDSRDFKDSLKKEADFLGSLKKKLGKEVPAQVAS